MRYNIIKLKKVTTIAAVALITAWAAVLHAQPMATGYEYQEKQDERTRQLGKAPMKKGIDIQARKEIKRAKARARNFSGQDGGMKSAAMEEGMQSGLCTDNLYMFGCESIDGLSYWDLANINDVSILCEGDPAWYHDFTDMVHFVPQLYENTLTVKAGFWMTYIDVWIDYNDDLLLTGDEHIINDGYLYEPGLPYTFDFTVPESVAAGQHVMRVRTNFNEPVTSPCSTFYYGNCADFMIDIVDPIVKDVGVVSIDIPGVVEPGQVTPYANIKNFGIESQSFDVTITCDDGYSATSSVSDLEPGEMTQVFFDTWDAEYGTWQLEVCTDLSGDEISGNDCLVKSILVADAKPAYGYMAVDITGTSGIPVGPLMFDLNDPEVFYSLLFNPIPDFLSSACWIPGGLVYGTKYGGGLYEMNPETGELTYLMATPSMTGITYDGSKLYGLAADGLTNALYEIDVAAGQLTLVSFITSTGGLIISIDCNAAGDMFGYDIVDDIFYSIDKTNGNTTPIGPMGFDFAYAQDMSFDRDEDICYLAGYTGSTGGGLFSVDVSTGQATLIAGFPGQAEVTALAIPYESSLPENDMSVNLITEPVSGPNLTAEEEITIKILNGSQNPQSNFDISYSINGGTAVTETFNGTIDPNGNAYYTFATLADLSEPGTLFTITACTELPGDENPANDCAETDIFHSLSLLPPPLNISGEQIDTDVHLSWNSPMTSGTMFFDDFEDYANGDPVALNNPAWTTWTNNPGSNEDAIVSQEYSYSPSQSMKMQVSNDMVYPTGNIAIGKHDISHRVYFPANNSGWFIMLQSFDVGNYVWGSQAYFASDGTGYIDGGGAAAASFTFDYETWLNVRNYIDLEDDIAEFWIDDELVHSWQWSTGAFGTGDLKQLGGADFFQPADEKFYIDDFKHDQEFTITFSGFEIYRNGEYIGTTTDTSFIDVTPVPGVYEYCVYAAYDLGDSEPACVTVDVQTGIDATIAGRLELYPVPAKDFLIVNAPAEIRSYAVYDVNGQVMMESQGSAASSIRLNTGTLMPGVYMLRVKTVNDRNFIEKIIKR